MSGPGGVLNNSLGPGSNPFTREQFEAFYRMISDYSMEISQTMDNNTVTSIDELPSQAVTDPFQRRLARYNTLEISRNIYVSIVGLGRVFGDTRTTYRKCVYTMKSIFGNMEYERYIGNKPVFREFNPRYVNVTQNVYCTCMEVRPGCTQVTIKCDELEIQGMRLTNVGSSRVIKDDENNVVMVVCGTHNAVVFTARQKDSRGQLTCSEDKSIIMQIALVEKHRTQILDMLNEITCPPATEAQMVENSKAASVELAASIVASINYAEHEVERAKSNLEETKRQLARNRKALLAASSFNPEAAAYRFKELNNHYSFIGLDTRGNIHAVTHPITVEYQGRRYKFGRFKVMLGQHRIYVKGLDTTSSRGSYHPHVSYGGDICFGNIQAAFTNARNSKDILSQLECIYAIVSSYSDHNPFEAIGAWTHVSEEVGA